jgi:hypothetical protein
MNIDMSLVGNVGHGPTTAALAGLLPYASYTHPSDAGRPIDSGRERAWETRAVPRRQDTVDSRAGRRGHTSGHSADFTDLVDEWGRQSFPASDPPANW